MTQLVFMLQLPRFSAMLAAVMFIASCGSSGKEVAGECTHAISDEEAVALAEEFVRVNGWTEHPAEPRRVVRGFMDTEPLDELLRLRHGVLKERAVGYSKHEHQWTVGFEYSKERLIQGKPTGLGVIVDGCGTKLSMPHETIWPYEMERLLQNLSRQCDDTGPER